MTELNEVTKNKLTQLFTVQGCINTNDNSLNCDKILLDTGALHASYVSTTWLDRHRQIFQNSIKPTTATVQLGDGNGKVPVTECITLPVTCTSHANQQFTAHVQCYVMPLSQDIVIGLPDIMQHFKTLFLSQLGAAFDVIAQDRTLTNSASDGFAHIAQWCSPDERKKPPWQQDLDTCAPEDMHIDEYEAKQFSFLNGKQDTDEYLTLLHKNITPAMLKRPTFLTYMETTAKEVFVPQEWLGISGIDPIHLNFDPNMPKERYVRPRPIHPSRIDAVRAELARLHRYLYILAKSPWVSPIVVANKATPPYIRLAIDYRWINQYIIAEQQYIPIVQHEIEKLQGFKFFTNADMTNSFHQLPIDDETSTKLAIIHQDGVSKPKFLPEGCKPASGILHRTVADIFSDMREYVIVIFDNLLVCATTEDELEERTIRFLERCRERNIHLKMAKTDIGFSTVKFFGYEVDGTGYRIDADRHTALNNIPFPGDLQVTTTKKTKHMQSFLGFSLYFRHFVSDYAQSRAPLDDMCKKDFNWETSTWTVDYRHIFQNFKDKCAQSFSVHFPDFSLPWILQTDASNYAIGSILLQIRTLPDGLKRAEPIHVFSQKLSPPATRWPTIKQEAYAIFASVKNSAYYLEHKPFTIHTDHRNLQFIEKSEDKIITRWRLFLQSFPIEAITHIKGTENIAADYLSRLHDEIDVHSMAHVLMVIQSNFDNREPQVQPVYSHEAQRSMFGAVHGNKELCFGLNETYRRLNETFQQHGISMKQLRNFINECPNCLKNRLHQNASKIPPAIQHIKAPHPHSSIAIDGLTITPPDSNGNTYVHVIINQNTKLVYLHVAPNKSAIHAAEAVMTYIAHYGLCDNLYSDQGPDYDNEIITHLIDFFGMRHLFTLTNRPQANGIVERANQEIIRHLTQLTQDTQLYDRWSSPQVIRLIQYYLNTTPKSTTHVAPFALHFGTLNSDYFNTFLPRSLANPQKRAEFINKLNQDIQAVRNATINYQASRQMKTDQRNNQTVFQQYQSGDFVFKDNPRPRPYKLDSPKLGPYQVVQQTKNNVAIRNLINDTVDTVDVSILSPFLGTPEQAFSLAQHDARQHLLETILAIKGDPSIRTTTSYLVRFRDGDEIWQPYSTDISSTEAFETFCHSNPMYRILLLPAATIAQQKKTINRTPIDPATYDVGQVFYTDMRIYGCAWFDSLTDLPDRHTKGYYTSFIVTQRNPRKRNVETIDVKDTNYNMSFTFDHYTIHRFALQQPPKGATSVTPDLIRSIPALNVPCEQI